MNQQFKELSLDNVTLAEELAAELTDAEIEQVGGGIWTGTDNGSMCDGPIYVN